MPRRVRKKQTKKSTPVISAPPADEEEEESGWYVIKDIIDERRVRGKVEYLIDWEDNPDTGKSYDPTWVSQHAFTRAGAYDVANHIVFLIGRQRAATSPRKLGMNGRRRREPKSRNHHLPVDNPRTKHKTLGRILVNHFREQKLHKNQILHNRNL
jgi:hypothetical protein